MPATSERSFVKFGGETMDLFLLFVSLSSTNAPVKAFLFPVCAGQFESFAEVSNPFKRIPSELAIHFTRNVIEETALASES